MFLLSRRFRLKDLRLALPSDRGAVDFRFHEPFDSTGAYVAPGPEGPTFIRVSIFPSETAPGEPGPPSSDAIEESAIEANPPQQVLTYFESVVDGRFPEDIPESPELRHFFGQIKPGDPIPPNHDVAEYWMPKTVAAYLETLHGKVIDYAQRVADLFRWATTGYHVDGRVYAPTLSVPMWSLSGSPTRPILLAVQMTIKSMLPPVVPIDAANGVVQSVGQLGESAPVADEIIREAWALRETNPRAAVVLAVASAEAGFRRLVSDLVPDARYLVEELQTPPLTLLLRNYLPKLPLRSTPRLAVVPRSVLRQLEAAVKLRNAIVHKGTRSPDHRAVEDALVVASDLVRLFDYYSGNQWALKFVTEETRSAAYAAEASASGPTQ